MPFDFDTPRTFFEKGARAVDWVAEEIIRQKNWRSLLVLIDVVLFLAFNPFEWPFPNLLSLFPKLRQFGWYAPVFWSLIGVIFIIAVIVAARAKRKTAEHAELRLGAIKGLLPFGYEDAEVFSHLQRDQNLKECLQAIGDEQWRFGVLSGESGAGKTSFLQAGLWPELEKRKFRCVYVKFSDLDPFESVKRACLKHLSFADSAVNGADLHGLLRAAAAQDRTPVVFFFDQFEQFFVHRKRRKDREPFAQALAQWFAEMESPPIKILICVRGDFFDRLNELQKAMRYSLSPTQSFRLERFEPDQAAEVFCFLAEKEGLEYDRKFISEMTRQELADAEDGLISPVDIQVLARMIERQTTQGARALNRATFQKLGGVEGLLERYLTTALEPLVTQSRRQAAIKVLLALTDLERNARAGALTFGDLRRKLDEIADSELKDAVAYLLLGDVRLISPLSENEEEKFELAHERLIPALRRLAGKQLSLADRADQLLDRRTNEWLGNGRSSRYLFSWSELRLINKHRRFVTWGKQRQAKEELLTASRRRFRLRYAALGLAPLLVLCGWVGWNSNAWQAYLIKRELRNYGNSLNDSRALTEIAKAFFYAGEPQLALQIVERTSNSSDKANALIEIAEFYARLGDKERASALLPDAIKSAERIGADGSKVSALIAIAKFYARLGDKERASALLPDAIKTAERISDDGSKASTLINIAESYAELGDTEKASALLPDAIKTAERISYDSTKAFVLRSAVRPINKIKDKEKARLLLSDLIKAAERISSDSDKSYVLSVITDSYTMLGKTMKDSALLSDAIETAARIGADHFKASALINIAESYVKLDDKEKARALLSDAIKTAERISKEFFKASALGAIAESYAKLGDKEKAGALLSDAIRTAERISDDGLKAAALRSTASFIAGIENKEKTGPLLSDAIKAAGRINSGDHKAYALITIAESYARLGDKERASALLSDAIRAAERVIDNGPKAIALMLIAKSYASVGDKEKARALLLDIIKTAEQINIEFSKDSTLSEIVEFYVKLAESSDDPALYEVSFRLIEGIRDDSRKNQALDAILSSKFALADVGRLRSLTSHYGVGGPGKARALARILMACLRPDLIGKESNLQYR